MKYRTIATMFAALSLSGCFTAMLWEGGGRYRYTETQYQTAAEDRILAFGIAARDNPPLEKGSLVMMGGKYWFAVNPVDSAALAEILKVRLDKQFQMVKNDTPDIAGSHYKAMPVMLEAPGRADFSSELCLRYDTAEAEEAAKLTALSFKKQGENKQGGHAYFRCIAAKGRYYAAQQNLPADYRFEKSIPVEILYPVKKNRFDGEEAAKKAVLTPLALAGDALGGILLLPVYLQFKDSRKW